MEEKDKKDYIKRVWKVSSGRKITEMLRRYWKLKKQDLIGEAQSIFGKKPVI